MPRCSNSVVCIANFLTVLIAIPLVCFGVWMKNDAAGQCQRTVQWLVIITGLVLLVISLFGIFGSCCRLNFFMWIYLFLMFLLIISTTISLAFSFSVTSEEVEETMSEYRLGNSSSWLQKWATKNWDNTEKCMKESKLCSKKVMQMLIKHNNTVVGNFFKRTELYKQLSPIQVGCCQPPSDCGFTHMNATYWEEPKPGNTSPNGDCKIWDNSEDRMCYGCESCKDGMIMNARRNLRINAWIDVVIVIFLVIIYSLGCCAFRNNQAHKYERYG